MTQPLKLRYELLRLLTGDDPKLRRLLGYWAATGVFYVFGMCLMYLQIENGNVERNAGTQIIIFGMSCLAACYVMIRASKSLRIPPWLMAVLQALVALGCNAAIYSISGPIRGSTLMLPLVVIVFCTFSLRPRQTMALCAATIAIFGGTIAWLVVRDPLHFPLDVEIVHFALAAASLLSVSLVTGEMGKLRARLKRQKEELLTAVATIRTLATVDELTSLANRRHMNEVLGAEERRASGGAHPVCIALLDIDFFKSVNDRYGHAGGDAVLRTFAAAAREALRGGDVLARWGGEEFLLMLPNTGLAEATPVLHRMAERVRAMRIGELDRELTVTFSAGLAERSGDEPFADTISRADRALYVAKASGRNQVIPMAAPPA
ncbi:MAG: diguanylate cyclase [Pseudomonadota bacterium]